MALTINSVVVDGTSTRLRIDDGTIVAVGATVMAERGDEIIDARDMAAAPGFVNGHTHAAMTLLRGFGDDLLLREWLESRIWPAERHMTSDDVYWGTRLAALEMIRTGTTNFFDMYWHNPAVAKAARDAGIRTTVAAAMFDGAGVDPLEATTEQAETWIADGHRFGPLITPALGPHAVYTVGEASLRRIAEIAADRDVSVQIHLSETREEVENCVNDHGDRPAVYLDRLGLLGPHVLLAHGCWLDPHELDLIAERGATIVTNPVSNMKLAGGRAFPFPHAFDRGIALGLGTDGAASNNSLDMLADLKVLALLQRHTADDPSVLPATEALAIAQGRRSPLLGGRALEVGAPADLVLIDTTAPELTPGDLTANLVYSASGSVIDTTIVAGQVLMRNRVVADADEVLAEARSRAARIIASV
jgi:5-methylthioadenosine/S-adenosylhomocysteine deaminase